MPRRPPRRPDTPRPPGAEPERPSLRELERFTRSTLKQWQIAAKRLNWLQRSLYFDLEPLRQGVAHPLLDAIRQGATHALEFSDWCRIVDYRYSLTPLSVAGSLRQEGGRFNIGEALSPGSFTAFPALYIADDFEAAQREKFGARPPRTPAELSSLDLALRTPASFTQCRLRGRVNQLLDVSNPEALKPFVDVIKQFVPPRQIALLARQLNIRRAPWLIRSVSTLRQQLLHPHWRMQPMQFDLPSNSQIFGRIAAAAGIHGILYPSVRQVGKQCLALFPQNWAGSASFVEVMDAVPAGATLTRIDGVSATLF